MNELKGQLIEIVREFREAFQLKQDDESLHFELIIEETLELANAETYKDAVDAYADLVFVMGGAIIDGFDHFNEELGVVIDDAEEQELDLLRATQVVFTSNMSKLCSKAEITPTADKYAELGVAVHFDPVDELDESAGFRCICSHSVKGVDGKDYPKGKLLKSVGYKEPDFSYLEGVH